MLRGEEVRDIEELKRQGLSIQAISKLTGIGKLSASTCCSRKGYPRTDSVRRDRANWTRSSHTSKSA